LSNLTQEEEDEEPANPFESPDSIGGKIYWGYD
jgi:hypothetical protein